MNSDYDRRDFLRLGATVGAGLALGGIGASGCAVRPRGIPPKISNVSIDSVRIGFVGVGGRGTHLCKLLLGIQEVQMVAVCDIVEEKVTRIQELAEADGRPRPTGYTRGEKDYERLCNEEDLDLVITATPWDLHTPICVSAMKAGKHAATEVPAAVTFDECWQLVETSEKMNRHCIMLENTCYSRWMMAVYKMIREGVFGEILHGECGYKHDLRGYKFANQRMHGPAYWRTVHTINRNGDIYPTHGIGPMSICMDINRGDQFDFLVSLSSNSRSLNLYAEKAFGPDHSFARQKYALGDVISTLIQTKSGKTILLQHDTHTPRPYSRGDVVQGTNAIFRGYPSTKIHIDGRTSAHEWESMDQYYEEYESDLWKSLGKKSEGSGHSGIDYMTVYRLIQVFRKGVAPEMNVYDAAAWSAISEATERSIAHRSSPVNLPDFTRGAWKTNPPIGAIQA